jgi:uncharacterized membrane protein
LTIVQTAMRGPTRRQLLWVVLALSLALNLFFAAGAVWIRLHPPAFLATPEQRLQQMATELALDPQQRAAFEQYSQTMHQRLTEMRQAARPMVRAAWSEVKQPQANEAKVMQLLDQAAETRRGFLRQMTATTLAFMKTLSPQQRGRFVELAHQRPPPWTPAPAHSPD